MKNCVQNIASIWIIDIHTLADSRHRLFALLFACLASLSAVFAQCGTCGENLTWTLENGVLTISGTGPMQDFDFNDPTSWHYNRTSITSVVINEGITSIGNYAFYGCTGLTSVIMGNSVTSIGNEAFGNCENLTSVTIGNSVKNIGFSAFAFCSGLTSIKIPNSVTHIGESAFEGCRGLTSVTIPNSVISIGNGAFEGCKKLTSVTMGNSVTSVGWNAFSDCTGLTSPVYNDHVFAYLPKNYSGAYTIPDGIETIASGAFEGCRGLTSVTIPNSVISIGSGAFEGCKKLTSVIIPNSVTSIESSAFSGCTGLTSVIIGNSVKSIGDGAFSGCISLTSVTIPNSVASIGGGAFSGCSGLALPIYNDHVFAYMPTSYSGAYAIPDGIESIAGGAFDNCTGLTSVTIPNSVTSIGRWTFDGCSGLTSVTIPNSVTSIGEGAFSGCTSLTSVAIPNSVSIEPTAFSGCGNLTSITIQEIRFKIYKDKNCYYEMNEGYGEFHNDIMWPIAGLPADKLHSLRQCILNAYAFDEVASALSAKVDEPNFHTSLFKTMRNGVAATFDMKYLPSSKVPKNAELGCRGYGMGLARVKNGVYTFFFVWDYVSPGAAVGDEGMHSLNYDMERNRPLALSDILQVDNEAEINRIYRYLVNQWFEGGFAEEEFDKDLYFGDKENWYLSDEGIVFTLDLWEDLYITFLKHRIVEVTLPLSKYKHLFRPEALKYWANCVESSILLSSELDAANERISQIVQQHNEVINRLPYTQYLNKSERTRFMPTYSPFQIPDAYDYDQAKAFCDSLQRVANSLSQQDPMTTVTSIKNYLRTTRPDDFVKAYLKENLTAKAHLESEHKEYRCHYASFTDFVLQYEQGRLQPSERNCRELKWQEYRPYYNNKKAFDADYDKGDEHLEAHKRHYELKWAEYKQYYSSREAFDADYHQGDATLEIHKKREIKWAECADYYEARYIFDFDYDKGETVVDAHRRRIDEAWSSLQQLPEELLVKKKLIGASESKKEDILNLFSLYRQLKPSPHFQSLAADFLISRNKKMSKEYEKNGAYFSSKIAFLTAYFSGDYKHIIKSMK